MILTHGILRALLHLIHGAYWKLMRSTRFPVIHGVCFCGAIASRWRSRAATSRGLTRNSNTGEEIATDTAGQYRPAVDRMRFGTMLHIIVTQQKSISQAFASSSSLADEKSVHSPQKERHIVSKRLTNRTYRFAAEFGKPRTDYTADEVGGLADVFRYTQAAGVSPALSSPLRNLMKTSWTQIQTMSAMTASASPRW